MDENWLCAEHGGTGVAQNARLISAAPELLNACESVLSSIYALDKDPTLERCAMALENAITKARG